MPIWYIRFIDVRCSKNKIRLLYEEECRFLIAISLNYMLQLDQKVFNRFSLGKTSRTWYVLSYCYFKRKSYYEGNINFEAVYLPGSHVVKT